MCAPSLSRLQANATAANHTAGTAGVQEEARPPTHRPALRGTAAAARARESAGVTTASAAGDDSSNRTADAVGRDLTTEADDHAQPAGGGQADVDGEEPQASAGVGPAVTSGPAPAAGGDDDVDDDGGVLNDAGGEYEWASGGGEWDANVPAPPLVD